MNEILSIPEKYLLEVIHVIRKGIYHSRCSKIVNEQLKKWCDEEEEYLKGLGSERP